MQVAYRVRNVQRAIGTRSSSAIVRKFGMDALADGRLTVKLEGSCGQSLGAFGVKGLTLDVVGDANDYVGKGLSGATICLRPSRSSGLKPDKNNIIGNTCLYGATSGNLYASGRGGERFAAVSYTHLDVYKRQVQNRVKVDSFLALKLPNLSPNYAMQHRA